MDKRDDERVEEDMGMGRKKDMCTYVLDELLGGFEVLLDGLLVLPEERHADLVHDHVDLLAGGDLGLVEHL